MHSLEIRHERTSDRASISSVTAIAFRDMPYADGDEQDVIERLRSSGALTLSLVAVFDGAIVGHVAFSPARVSDGTHPWFALGPVSVVPAKQRQGVGSALIERGLSTIRESGALGCILTGNPEYYRRFGFTPSPQNVPDRESEEFFMLKLFTNTTPTGVFQFDGAFYGDARDDG